jgi:hypothetical protein
MPASFGARLRRRREEQGIALSTIAAETKIKLSLLEALEQDDISHWPSGIFRRAYIRAYAHAIGLCPDDVVHEFLEVHPEPPEVLLSPFSTVPTDAVAHAGGGPPTRLRHAVGSALGFLSRFRGTPRTGALAGVDDESGLPAARPDGQAPGPEPPPDSVDQVDRPWIDGPTPAVQELLAVADLCTQIGRAGDDAEVRRLLQVVAGILHATGLIVWIWDASAGALRPALAYGYSDRVLAQLPKVRRSSDNPTAAAFRAARMCAVEGGQGVAGALVVPLMTPAGCAGVLALETQAGGEREVSVQAAATIFASLLAQVVGADRSEMRRSPGSDNRPADSRQDSLPFQPLPGDEG